MTLLDTLEVLITANTEGLKTGIAGAKTEASGLSTSFKGAASDVDKLGTELDKTGTKAQGLSSNLASNATAFKGTASEADNLTTSLDKTGTKAEGLTTSLTSSTSSLGGFKSASQDAATATEDLGTKAEGAASKATGLSTSLGGVGRDLEGTSSKAKNLGGDLEGTASKTTGLGSSFGGLGNLAAAGLGGAAIAVTAFSVKAGESVQDAYNTMAKATGVQGEQLKTLEGVWSGVFANVPESAETVTSVIDTLTLKLGLQGQALQDAATDVIDYSIATGTSATSNITTFTTALNAANLGLTGMHKPVMDMPELSDMMTAAFQNTGVAVGKIAPIFDKATTSMTKMGMSIPQQIALIAQLSQAGIPARQVSTVLQGITKAATAAHESSSKFWGDMVEDAKKGTLTADETKLLGKSVDNFSSLAKAGKLDNDKLIDSITNSKGASEKAGEGYETMGEQIDRLKNSLTVAFAPIGITLINVLQNVLTAAEPLIGIVGTLAKVFAAIPAPIQLIALGAPILVGGLAAMNMVFSKIGGELGGLGSKFGGLIEKISGVDLASLKANKSLGDLDKTAAVGAEEKMGVPGGGKVGGVAAEGEELAGAEGVATEAGEVAPELEEAAGSAGLLSTIFTSISSTLGGILAPITGLVGGIGEAAAGALGIEGGLGAVLEVASSLVLPLTAVVGIFAVLYATSGTFRGMIGGILDTFKQIFGWVKDIIGALVGGNFAKVGDLLKTGFQGAINSLMNFNWSEWAGKMVTSVQESAGTIGNAIMGGLRSIYNIGTSVRSSIINALTTIDWGGVANSIVSGLASVYNIGISVRSSILSGLSGIGTALVGAFGALANIDWGQLFYNMLDSLDNTISTWLTNLENTDWTPVVTGLINAIGSVFDSLFGTTTGGGGGGSAGAKVSDGMSKSLSSGVQKAGPDIAGKLGDVLKKLAEIAPEIFYKIGTALIAALEKVDYGAVFNKMISGPLMHAVAGAFTNLPSTLAGALGGIGSAVSKINWGDAIAGLFKTLAGSASSFLQTILQLFRMVNWLQIFQLMFVLLPAFGQSLIQGFQKVDWGQALGTLGEAIKHVLGGIGGSVLGGLGSVGGMLGGAASGVGSALSGAAGTVGSALSGAGSTLSGAAGGLGSAIKSALTDFGSWLLKDAIPFFTGLPGKFATALVGFGTWLWKAAEDFVSNATWKTKIAAALTGFASWLWTAASDFVANTTWASKLATALVGLGSWLWTAAVDFVTNSTWASKLAAALVGLGSWLWTAAVDFVTNATWATKMAAALLGLASWLWTAAADFISNSTWMSKMTTALSGLGGVMINAAQSFFDKVASTILSLGKASPPANQQSAKGQTVDTTGQGAGQTLWLSDPTGTNCEICRNLMDTYPKATVMQGPSPSGNFSTYENPFPAARGLLVGGSIPRMQGGGLMGDIGPKPTGPDGSCTCPPGYFFCPEPDNRSCCSCGLCLSNGTPCNSAAAGSLVGSRSGGIPVIVGEGGRSEAIIPSDMWWGVHPAVLNALPRMAGGGIIPAPGSMNLVGPGGTSPTLPTDSSQYYDPKLTADQEILKLTVLAEETKQTNAELQEEINLVNTYYPQFGKAASSTIDANTALQNLAKLLPAIPGGYQAGGASPTTAGAWLQNGKWYYQTADEQIAYLTELAENTKQSTATLQQEIDLVNKFYPQFGKSASDITDATNAIAAYDAQTAANTAQTAQSAADAQKSLMSNISSLVDTVTKGIGSVGDALFGLMSAQESLKELPVRFGGVLTNLDYYPSNAKAGIEKDTGTPQIITALQGQGTPIGSNSVVSQLQNWGQQQINSGKSIFDGVASLASTAGSGLMGVISGLLTLGTGTQSNATLNANTLLASQNNNAQNLGNTVNNAGNKVSNSITSLASLLGGSSSGGGGGGIGGIFSGIIGIITGIVNLFTWIGNTIQEQKQPTEASFGYGGSYFITHSTKAPIDWDAMFGDLGQIASGFGSVMSGAMGMMGGGMGLQHGGIVTAPIVSRLGEGGPEAVIPLKKGANALGNQYTINMKVSGDENAVAVRKMADQVVKQIKRNDFMQNGWY
jgi:hypothetical protein